MKSKIRFARCLSILLSIILLIGQPAVWVFATDSGPSIADTESFSGSEAEPEPEETVAQPDEETPGEETPEDAESEIPESTPEGISAELEILLEETPPEQAWYLNDPAAAVFSIGSAKELQYLAELVNRTENPVDFSGKTIRLTASIDLSGMEWIPIGTYANKINYFFKGTFDGQGNSISGLSISLPAQDYVGLFGCVSGAAIRDLTVSGGTVEGNSNVGGLIGFADSSTIVENCVNYADVKANTYAGGIAGYITGNVYNCFNAGSVLVSGQYGGGVCGYIRGAVSKCYNTGAVQGADRSGGIAGTVNSSSSTVSNCYNTGDVSGTGSNIGGIVGYTSVTSVAISNCYNLDQTGLSNGISTRGKLTNCYFLNGSDTGAGKTAASFNSGEVSWFLNMSGTPAVHSGLWGLAEVSLDGVTAIPVFSSAEYPAVYKAQLICDNADAPGILIGKKGEYAPEGTAIETEVVLSEEFKDSAYELEFVSVSPPGLSVSKTGFTMPQEDVTIHYTLNTKIADGTKYTVTFDYNYAESDADYASQPADGAQTAEWPDHTAVAAPEEPQREGYHFLGWFVEGGSEPYDFSSAVRSSFTLYARWERIIYSVIVDKQDGSSTATVQVEYGKAMAALSPLTREGYSFVGWYEGTKADGQWVMEEEPFDFSELLKRTETTLYLFAVWSGDAYSVVYHWSDSIETTVENVKNGSLLTLPPHPEGVPSKISFNWHMKPDFSDTAWNFSIQTINKAMIDTENKIHFYGRGIDTSWYSAGKNTFELSEKTELLGLAQLVNGGTDFSGKTVKLAADIDLENRMWNPIGTYVSATDYKAFKGVFDGQDHAVKGLFMSTAANAALFGCIDGSAEIKDLTVEGSLTVSSTTASAAGIVAVMKNGSITRVNNKAAVGATTIIGSMVGGIAGKQEAGTISNCENYGMIGTSAYRAGTIAGIVGSVSTKDGQVLHCVNYADVYGRYAGGIAGDSYGLIDSSENHGNVITGYTSDYAGGIASRNYGTIRNSKNSGAVKRSLLPNDYKGYLGGIAGSTMADTLIENCVNSGAISGYAQHAGGISGSIGQGSIVRRCGNQAAMHVNISDLLGGITGSAVANVSIVQCFNTGDVTNENSAPGYGDAGGIVGRISGDNAKISYNYNTGNISGTSTTAIGGIVGCINSAGIIFENNYQAGEIHATGRGGSVAGYRSGTVTSLEFNYYDSGKCSLSNPTSVNITALSAEEMKAEEFLYSLGSFAFVSDNEGSNSGYPVLEWQQSAGAPDDLTVNFDLNNGSKAIVASRVEKNKKASEKSPVRTAYSLAGWYSNADGTGSPFDFDTKITEDITLYAKWTLAVYTITFDRNDGSSGEDRIFERKDFPVTGTGSQPIIPLSEKPAGEPELSGAVFLGWYEGAEQEDGSILLKSQPYVFGSKVFNNFTLYARWDKTEPDFSWYSTFSSAFTVTTKEQLFALALIVNGKAGSIKKDAFTGKTVTLGNDIDLENMNWLPIGVKGTQENDSDSLPFSGTFNGGGHIISNLSAATQRECQGLFGYVMEGSIKNLTIKDGRLENGKYSGALVGYIRGKKSLSRIENCHNLNTTVSSSTSGSAGGITGYAEYCDILDSSNSGTVHIPGNTGTVGGIAANGAGVLFSNCHNEGMVMGSTAGGIGGSTQLFFDNVEANKKAVITQYQNCRNMGTIDGAISGGIAGTLKGYSATGGSAWRNADSVITYCSNSGDVQASASGGGILGSTEYIQAAFCYNTGSVTGTGAGAAGGLFGTALRARTSDCYSTGILDGSGKKGAVLGQGADMLSYMSNIYASDKTLWDAGFLYAAASEQFADGYVAYSLNSNSVKEGNPVWSQGADGYPVFADADGSNAVYRIIAPTGPLEGGSFALSAYYPNAGSTVTVTLSPESGYIPILTSVRNSNGDRVEVTGEGNTYSFTMPKEDVNLRIAFGEDLLEGPFTIAFDTNGGTPVASQEVLKLEKAQEPSAPVKQGFLFIGWYLDASFKQEYDFDTRIIKDYTLFARWKSENSVYVEFNLNRGLEDDVLEIQEVEISALITPPSGDLMWGDFHLSGWTLDKQGKIPWDFGSAVQDQVKPPKDFTLYAQWGSFKGMGTQSDPFQLGQEELDRLDVMVSDYNETFEGKYFELTGDITITNPIGSGEASLIGSAVISNAKKFAGSLNGNNFTVTLDLTDDSAMLQGMFAYLGEGSSVANIHVNGRLEAALFAGGIAAYCAGTITDCSSDVDTTVQYYCAGGIAGYVAATGEIKNCTNSGSVTSTAGGSFDTGGNSQSYAGGIVGNSDGNVTACVNSGTIIGAAEAVGGITGSLNGSSKAIQDCSNSGNISCTGTASNIGGIAGSSGGSLKNCGNTGNVTAPQCYSVGGLAGSINKNLDSVTNEGNVSGKSSVGGIAGVGPSLIQNCVNMGNISAAESGAGGIVGITTSGVLDSCTNTGDISGQSDVGGVAGACRGMAYSSNQGAVSGVEEKIGGLVGSWTENSQIFIQYSYNLGPISAEGALHVGGILGYTDSNTHTAVISCFSYEGAGAPSGRMFGRAVSAEPGALSVVGFGKSERSYTCSGSSDISTSTSKPPEAFSSGEIAYLLDNGGSDRDGIWGQSLSADAYPGYAADGRPLIYLASGGGTSMQEVEGVVLTTGTLTLNDVTFDFFAEKGLEIIVRAEANEEDGYHLSSITLNEQKFRSDEVVWELGKDNLDLSASAAFAKEKEEEDPEPEETIPDIANENGEGSGGGSGSGSGSGDGDGTGNAGNPGEQGEAGNNGRDAGDAQGLSVSPGDDPSEPVALGDADRGSGEADAGNFHDSDDGGGNEKPGSIPEPEAPAEPSPQEPAVYAISMLTEAIRKNPLLTAAVSAAALAILLFAGIRRFRSYRKNVK